MDYIEGNFKRALAGDGASDSDMVNLISGNGGSQVDVVLYVLHQSKYLWKILGICR